MLIKGFALALLLLGSLATNVHSQDLGVPDTVRCGWSHLVRVS